MSTQYSLNPTDRLGKAIDYNALPQDYRNRIEDFDSRIAEHQLRTSIFQKAKRWTTFSITFDLGCVVLGAFFFHETWRLANEEVSFLRSVTTNQYLLRVGTPFPFFATLLGLTGLCFLPSDISSRRTTKRMLLGERKSIERLATARAELASEVASATGDAAK